MAESAIPTKAKAKSMTIKSMKKLGVYKREYDEIISIYAELLEQYAILTAEFEKGNHRCVSMTADGGEKKSPLIATLESLRKDILQYSDRLMLNPKAQSQPKGGTKEEGRSLVDALKDLSG